MEMVAFLAGLLVFGLVKLVLIATVTRNDGAEGTRRTWRGSELRVQGLETKVERPEAQLQASERDRSAP